VRVGESAELSAESLTRLFRGGALSPLPTAAPYIAGSPVESAPVSMRPAKRRLQSAWPVTRTLKSYPPPLAPGGSAGADVPRATTAATTS